MISKARAVEEPDVDEECDKHHGEEVHPPLPPLEAVEGLRQECGERVVLCSHRNVQRRGGAIAVRPAPLLGDGRGVAQLRDAGGPRAVPAAHRRARGGKAVAAAQSRRHVST